MPVIPGLGWTFDNVADACAKLRPGYVDALYQGFLTDREPKDSSEDKIEI